MQSVSNGSRRQHVVVLFGTRPEAIKMAPVVAALRRRSRRFRVTTCTTGQHREMLDQVRRVFDLDADLDLDLMSRDQGLNDLTARSVAALERVLAGLEREGAAPDWVLVQGDTTSAMAAALAAFHRHVRVGHVEAGLRTGDLARPFPEEANRKIIDALAAALFAPTARARRTLEGEGVDPGRIHVTGNTVVDALEMVAGLEDGGEADPPEVLITVHRRESFGAPLERILGALRSLAERFPDHRWVYPVHLNPNVRGPAHRLLGDVPNVELHPPFDYPELVRRLRRCRLVLTDSGGIQEEAPTFGKPVLVLRDTTERPEGVEAGVARLVGSDRGRILEQVERLLTDAAAHDAMARVVNPYGDGRAAERIVAALAGEEYTAWSGAA